MELNNLNQTVGLNLTPSPDKGSSKKVFFIIFLLVIIFVIFVFVYRSNRSVKNQENLAEDMDLSFLNTTSTIDNLVTETSTAKVTTTISALKKPVVKKVSASKPTSLSATSEYIKASNIYKTSGYYFQFVKCHGSPGSLVMKKGVKFMMDNRDNKAHKFVVMGKTYSVGAYGYTIVTADKVGKHYITCDGGGAAQITVAP